MNGAGTPPDPNAVTQSAGGVVLSTYNTGISYSTNGGQTFTDVSLFSADPANPARTTFFPESDGGLCCDQVVRYLPNRNLFIWLLQYQPVVTNNPGPPPANTIAAPNRLRVAWSTPSAIAADFRNAWTYIDLTGAAVANVSDGLGTAGNEWLDYPDLAQSGDFLFVGADHGTSSPGSVYTGRRIVARLSLPEIADPTAAIVHYSFAELTGSNGLNKSHFVQDAPERMILGSLDNTSTLRVFSWNNAAAVINPNTVNISSIQTTSASYTETAPDTSNWVGVSFPGNITGATFRSSPIGGEYIFAFDAGLNAAINRPRPYVRLESVINVPIPLLGEFSATAEYDIWNPDYAFAMAALGTQGAEIGMSLAVGGGTIGYPQNSVGFKDDFLVYTVTSSNATQISRFGDYFSARPIPGTFAMFSTEVYDVILATPPAGAVNPTCATIGCSARMRYVEFGRPEPPPIR